ncbi:29100_t:CDS:2, partial [Gigaspora margarita]
MLSITDTKEINIAIDSEMASDKLVLFKFQSNNFKTNFYKIIDHLNNLKNENYLDEINTIVENFSKEEYFFSGKKAAILAENDEICEAINLILCKITKEKGFVVVAEVKILLSADLNIRALRRTQQLDSDNITNNILLDIINCD